MNENESKEILDKLQSINGEVLSSRADLTSKISVINTKFQELQRQRRSDKKNLDKLIEMFNSLPFQKLLEYITYHIGDQENLMQLLEKSYGYEKKYSGQELLPEILEDAARKKERSHDNEKNIRKYGIKKLFDLIPKWILQTIMILGCVTVYLILIGVGK